jgi:hypothetical protein
VKDARLAAAEVVDQGIESFPALIEKLKEFEVERHLE